MSLLRYIFLRLYGANLERRSRARPEQACSDAITQTILVGILPCCAIVAAAVAAALRPSVESMKGGGPFMIFGTAILLTFLTWNFKDYANNPVAAEAFRSRASRRMTWLLFFLIPMAGIGLLTLALELARN
jgi:hypothetical protein